MTVLRGLRWWELIPEALLVAALTLFAVTEPSAAFSSFKSRTAIVLMLVVAIGWLLLRVVLLRTTRWPVLRALIFGVAALAVLRVVVFPAYDDTTVIETLPADSIVTPAPTPAVAPPSTTTTVPAPTPEPTTPPEPTLPEPTTPPAPAPEPEPVPAEMPMSTPPPATPRAIASAPLHGIDHRASGTARLYVTSSGGTIVGLEDIDIQPGPDYDVYIVPGADREQKNDAIRLDDLRGNKGTQYYDVPAGTDVMAGEWTVLVWCEIFDVPIAAATPVA